MYGSMPTKCIRCNKTDKSAGFSLNAKIAFRSSLLNGNGQYIGAGPTLDGTLCDGCQDDVLGVLLDGGASLV